MNEIINKEQQNTEVTTQIDALGLSIDNPASTDSRDQRIAELERELQTERVERGRAKKLSDDLRQLREENERMKSEIAALKQRNPADFLSQEERDMIDPDQAKIMGKMAKGMAEDALAPLKEENEKLRSQFKASEEARRAASVAGYTENVNRLAPGLLSVVLTNHKDAWQKWASDPTRKASISAATQNHDAETTAKFLKMFCDEKGISASHDGSPAQIATPSPSAGVATIEVGDKTVYSFGQYEAIRRQATEDFESGKIKADEYRGIVKKLDSALSEGRVKM